MHKKNILFITHELQCGGAEKALISLLQVIDYNLYNVDLQLFVNRGLFLKQVHPKVNILDAPANYILFELPIIQFFFYCILHLKFGLLIDRVIASIVVKNESNVYRKEQKMWKYLSKHIPKLTKKYDFAVGGIEKAPNYFCVEKVDADKKVGWVHNDYEKMDMSRTFDNPYFQKLDYILTDSEDCKNVLIKNFPQFQQKFRVMKNIVSPTLINQLAKDATEDIFNGFTIISVGRFSHQKGYDLAIPAMKIVKDKGHAFKWIILGDGDQKENVVQLINDNGLNDAVLLLGIKENHYPYVKQADVFMQTSRFEGKSISIDEAKILNKPILVTNFSTVNDQIVDNQTGLIAEMNSASIAEKMIVLITDLEVRKKLSHNLSIENNGTEGEIETFYNFLNN